MKLLEVQGLVKSYGGRPVVDGARFEVDGGEIVGLLGPNGAGKTTSFLMTLGLVRPEEGRILFRGKDITPLPMYRRARMGMGYLSQEPSVFRRLTVEDNILAILETLPLSRRERRERLETLLAELGLARLRGNRADTLSGGERRRLEITRALVTRPSLILLDEPFSGVDPIVVEDIKEIVLGLKERGIGILLTDHNVRDTLSITDRSYIIAEGRIFRHGPPLALVNDPAVRRVYLGEKFVMTEIAAGKETGITGEEERLLFGAGDAAAAEGPPPGSLLSRAEELAREPKGKGRTRRRK